MATALPSSLWSLRLPRNPPRLPSYKSRKKEEKRMRKSLRREKPKMQRHFGCIFLSSNKDLLSYGSGWGVVVGAVVGASRHGGNAVALPR